MGTILQDFRYGMRLLAARPVFTIVAIITLALGIGANTAIFSVVHAVLLKPLPYRQPDRLVVIYHDYRSTNFRASVSVPGFIDYRTRKDLFEDIAAVIGWSANLTGGDEPERLQGQRVSASYFGILGVRPVIGRDFREEEDAPGKDHVVILTDGSWRTRFGADPAIVGRTLTINGDSYSVIGVMPPDLWLPSTAEVFTPIAFRPEQLGPGERRNEFLSVIGRLKDGVSLDQARAAMEPMSDRLRAQFYNPGSRWAVGIELWKDLIVRGVRPALVVLQIAVLFVLLIACANVANLLLARSSDRRKEMAVRTALGASRNRVVRQLITESVMLAIAGASIGTALAFAGTKTLQLNDRPSSITEIQPGGIPRGQSISLDSTVLAFTLVISIATGIVFGLAPTVQVFRSNLSETLKESARGAGRNLRVQTIGHALVIAEFALSLTLLVAAGLLVKSFLRVQQVHTGFRSENVMTARVFPPASRYADEQSLRVFYQRLVAELAAQPGVTAAGATNVLPLSGQNNQTSFEVEGLVLAPGQPGPHGDHWMITPDYLRAMGIPLIKGRFFTEQDGPDAPLVTIIDDTLAAQFFPNSDPIGKHLLYGNGIRIRTIVGIVGHVKNYGLDGEDKVQVYLPHQQITDRAMFVVARGTSVPSVNALRSAIRNVDPGLPLFDIQHMDKVVSNSMGDRRFSTTLLGLFAAVALLLSAVGIYGVIAYSVTQRTHEIGVRMALGAAPRNVLGMVVRQAVLLAVIGGTIGVAGSYALTGFITKLLFQVSATDVPTFATITAVLVAVSLLAGYIPARRASRVDPAIALRAE